MKLLFLLLALLLALPGLSFSDQMTKEQALEELEAIFTELETIQIELQNGSKITAAELISLRIQLIELRKSNETVMQQSVKLRDLLSEAEKQLTQYEKQTAKDKTAAATKGFIAGISTGIILFFIASN